MLTRGLPAQSGFTLIESLIYIALLGLIMGGALLTTYHLIASAEQVQTKTIIDEEANFILRKFDWAMATNLTPANFSLADGDLRLNGVVLNSRDAQITDFTLVTAPNLITVRFKLGGQPFESTHYRPGP